MRITVLNGSPRGKYSITIHTSLYLQKLFPEHTFEIVPVASRIHALEKDLTPVLEPMRRADLIIFSYPVYTFLVPSQLHRFLELLKESGEDLSGKYMTQITTSKHFYDVTAHRFLEENAFDLGMKVLHGLSADMEDLTKKEGQEEAAAFFLRVCRDMENGFCEVSRNPAGAPQNKRAEDPAVPEDAGLNAETGSFTGQDAGAGSRAGLGAGDREPAGKAGGPPVIIVADLRSGDTSLARMISAFREKLPFGSRLVNLRDHPLKGGCLGCMNCAATGDCIYKDGFQELLRSEIQTGSAIIYAFAVRDHSMGSLMKQFDDRQFCNGHRTVTMGMPVGYLISGPYSAEPNLQMLIEARAQTGGNYLAGTASDETDPEGEIRVMTDRLVYAIRTGYCPPRNFYGIGGMKIFRDLIYTMRGMMKADHKFYKSRGQYDFPQKQKGKILLGYLLGALVSNPKIRKKMGNKMNEGMTAPYRKVIEKAGRYKET